MTNPDNIPLSMEQSFQIHSFNTLVDGITSLPEAKKLLKELNEQMVNQKALFVALLKDNLNGEFQRP